MELTIENLVKMIDLADEVMSICGGDQWERECSAEARGEFQNMKVQLDRLLKRGEHSDEAIAKKEAEEKAMWETKFLFSQVDCPVCGKRIKTMMGIECHMLDAHGIVRLNGRLTNRLKELCLAFNMSSKISVA